jgi:single-strand DNA-binding protein
MNKVILVGRLARDPEVRYTQSGKAFARMTIAVDRRFGRNGGGDQQQQTADFIPLVAWDKLAEICGNNLRKGRQILVEGRIQVRSYEAQDGTKKYATDVVINEMEFMDSKPRDNGGDFAQNAPMSSAAPAAPAAGNAGGSFGAPVTDDDIPF